MIKPQKLQQGDTIATISPSWGCAGAPRVRWQYNLGVKRLEELGLKAVSAPNSLKGTTYLKNNPKARAEDLMWAFENKNVKAIIANIGGNDTHHLLPYLSPSIIQNNPKIFCGYSDIMVLHLFCYKAGLSTFYGDNLLTTIADAQGWHPYSKHWFEKAFFSDEIIGNIPQAKEWTYEPNRHTNPNYKRSYTPSTPLTKIQGEGIVEGKLFGGHSDMMFYNKNFGITLNKTDFEDKILFFEDIPEVTTPEYIGNYFDWLGKSGYLQLLKGIIIGKMRMAESFDEHIKVIKNIVSEKYNLPHLPILYGLNFGHASPIFILPYGAKARLDLDNLEFSILESGVVSY